MQVNSDQLSRVKSRALMYLSKREYSAYELRTKLQAKGFSQEIICVVIKQLIASNLQSDDRFAESYSRYRQAKGFGPLHIRQDLQCRGVDQDIVDKYLSNDEYYWRQQAQLQLDKKFGTGSIQDYTQLAAMKRFLHYRGFSSQWLSLDTQ